MLGGYWEVITLKSKQETISLFIGGMSIRKISKKLKMSRNTVAKYIREYEESKSHDVRNLPVTKEILRPPSYKKRVGRKRVLAPEMMNMIRGFLEDNEWKRKNNMSKQQMKMVDMHQKLLDAGYSISYSTVRNFVNEESAKSKEVFIRKNSEPSQEVEFDWGEVKLEINGKIKSYSLAVFALAHSNYRFAKLYQSESQVCDLDVHTRFIEHIGFVPSVFTYDNTRTVVKSFIGKERTITDSMVNLSNYYYFKIRLCEPRKGNQKGHVERSVEFIRRKAFSSEYSFSSLVEAEQHLASTLVRINGHLHHEKKIKHIDLMQQEKAGSKQETVPSPFDAAELVECRVDKYSTVVIKQNHYSVPEGHVGKWIKGKIGAEKVKLIIDGVLVADHQQNWGVHQ
jgi:transposase